MHQSHIPQCTIFATEMWACAHISVTQWCDVGYLLIYCGICEMGLYIDYTFHEENAYHQCHFPLPRNETESKYVFVFPHKVVHRNDQLSICWICSRKREMNLHFLSFINTKVSQVVEIVPRGTMQGHWSLIINTCTIRLFHSPSLVVVGLSVGYETWPPIGPLARVADSVRDWLI